MSSFDSSSDYFDDYSSDSFETSSLDSFSSSSSDSRWMHDVFISFREQDTRSFASHLHAALRNAGIEPYIDEDQLLKGTDLGSEHFRPIENSRLSIIVFSKGYTESRWCLNELEKIMECRRTHDQLVFPVFYHVDPSTVRHQKGDFGQVLIDTATKLYFRPGGEEKMEQVLLGWRTALTQAAGLSGWDVNSYRNEAELVQRIVKVILRMLNRATLFVAEFPVGLQSRMQKVIEFIVNQSSKVCLIGICGMGGSGKTTIAKAIYNQIHGNFVYRSFIKNIKEVCERGDEGIIHLQEQLLSDILNTKEEINSIAEGEMMIKERFQGRKVLVVLDDVTSFVQLKSLCPNHELLCPGSVLIGTTRDERLLNLIKVDYVCKMEEMDEKEALELFSWHAFRQPSPREDFSKLSRNVVAYCGGLPVALEVLGSYLCDRSQQEWRSVLTKLETIPNDQVKKKLKISYDGLKEDMEKDIFLDICCFFVGQNRADVIEILNGSADIVIPVLLERNLVKIEENDKLGMHDLIRDMGREIARESSLREPGGRRRLWLHDDVHDVLTQHTGAETVEGLVLKSQTGKVCLATEAFKKMKKLKHLQLDHVDLTGDYGKISKQLRFLHWERYPLNHIPDDFYLGNLVVFELKHSNIKQLWNKSKVLVNLKVLNLSHSKYLKSSPDFSKFPNLEKLFMKDCPCLSKIHPSIGDLNRLLLINLKDCTGLQNLPKKIYKLKSLETLILSGCFKIGKLEEDIEQMESLTTLIAKNTAVTKVPFAIARSKSIRHISLCGYEGLSHDIFPSLIWSWMSPTMKFLPRISPFWNISYGLASIDDNLGFLSPLVSRLLRLRIIGVQFRSKIQLAWVLQRILDDQFDVSFSEVEASHASQILNLSLRSPLIGVGSFHRVMDTLSKSISQGLATNGSGEFVFPGNNYPSWLAYTGEGPSVHLQVPEDSVRCMKGITLLVVYSVTSENMEIECLASVLIINYTKLTVHIYKRDTIMAFNDEDWKNITSNLGPGDNVEIFVSLGHGLIVKETSVYLIYDQPITTEVDGDAKSKGGPSRCDNKRDMDEASKRYEKILNQSEDADE